MSEVAQTSVYLNDRDREILHELQARTGMTRTQLFRLGLERLVTDNAERTARLTAIAEEIKTLA